MRHLLSAVLVLSCLGTARAHAQLLFGQNKVVYEDREWSLFTEGMLELYFYPAEQELAVYAMGVARETYAEFAEYFDYEFEKPIPLILYGTHHDLKQTHVIPNFVSDGTAGFTEFAKGRIALRGTGRRSELRHLIRHEMVHAFMLAKLSKVMIDRGIFDYTGPPLWFIEGLAESVANARPDTQARMVMRDALLQDGLVPIPQMWKIWGSFQMYKQGESILDFLREQFGDGVPVLLLDKWWRGRSFEEVLELELGMDLEELDRRWRGALKRRYFPEISRRRPAEDQGTALAPDTRFATVPTVISASEEGLRVACLSARSGTISLHELRSDRVGGPHWRRLVEGAREARFESLPFLRSRLDCREERYVAFVAKNGGRDALYVYDLEERKVVEDHRFDGIVEISSPAFSPEGDRIAFGGLRDGGRSDLYVVERRSGELTRVTDDVYHDTHPDWNPMTGEIVFVSDRLEERLSLFTARAETNAPAQLLVDTGGDDTQPRWDAQGERLVFASDRGGAFDLLVVDADGSHAVACTDVTGGAYSPDWTEDGHIVATVFQGGRFSLYRFPGRQRPGAKSWTLLTPRLVPATVVESEDEAVDIPVRDYEVDLGLDFVQSVVALDPDLPYGSGASLGFTDMLGDHRLFAHLSTATDEFKLEDLNVGISYSDLGQRWNRHYGVFRVAVRPRLSQVFRQEYSEVRTGGFFGVTYPFSRYRRVEITSVLRHLERDASFQLPGEPGSTWLASAFVSLVHDNTLWTWQGPMRGVRWNATVGQTFDVLDRGFDRQTVQLDYRRYDELRRGFVLAHRAAWRGSFGSDSQFFYLGGPNDLRGYDWSNFTGERITLVNSELRFPLIENVMLRFAFGPFELPAIRGAVFNDVARVSGRLDDTGWIGSFGYSVSMTLIPPLVLRFDVARPHDFEDLAPVDRRLSFSFLF